MLASLFAALAKRRAVDAAIAFAVGDVSDPAAFDAMCSAVGAHLEAQKKKAGVTAPVMPFGPKKGQPLSALTPTELENLERFVSASLRQPEKARFRNANLALRAQVLAELHRHHF